MMGSSFTRAIESHCFKGTACEATNIHFDFRHCCREWVAEAIGARATMLVSQGQNSMQIRYL